MGPVGLLARPGRFAPLAHAEAEVERVTAMRDQARADYQRALTDFNQSLQLEPNYSKAHFNRGLVYYQLNNNDLACNDFQTACDQGDCDGIKWANKNEVGQETELMGLR